MVASSASADEENVLKKALKAHNNGKMFPFHCSAGEKGLKKLQRKENELVQGFVEVANSSEDKEALENVEKKHSEYCLLVKVDFGMMPEMCVYRLLLENALLTRQIKRLQNNLK